MIGVTQECDSVVQGVSPEGATALNASLTKLKARLSAVSNEVRGKLNYLSDSIIARQEFDAKAADFASWVADFEGKQKASDVYYDKLDQAMGTLHAAMQEHADHLGQFKELEEDVKMYKAGLAGPATFEELGSQLALRKDLLSQWIHLSGWVCTNYEMLCLIRNEFKYFMDFFLIGFRNQRGHRVLQQTVDDARN